MLRIVLFAILMPVVVLFQGAGAPQSQAQGRPPVQQGPPSTSTHLPPSIANAPYNGPSTRAPAGLNVPRTQQEAQQVAQQLQANPAVAAAHAASQATIAAQGAFRQRMRSGVLPTEADKQHGQRYQIEAPRRSEVPVLRLLGLTAPDESPDEQVPYFGGFLCFVWENFYLDRDQWGDDIFGSQGLNYCFPPATNEAVAYTHVSLDIYKCGFYFITWDICLGQQHWYELWPSCEGYYVTYLWCGGGGQRPRVYYPFGLSGAYFLRVTGHIQTAGGQVGQAYIDSEVLPYQCFQGGGIFC